MLKKYQICDCRVTYQHFVVGWNLLARAKDEFDIVDLSAAESTNSVGIEMLWLFDQGKQRKIT